ncbi:YdiK family protein [Bacillus massilinigeriensis]|uniref:YdiK family protein n=1 Tax=Bacillus mediterraneensis TaxID=1805474 RepID=UPI0008F850E4|nr:YdiK family protein [Bacillus mediterraneensis]
MRQSPLVSGIFYILFGVLFTYFAIVNVEESGWGFWTYTIVLVATFDFGSGIRMLLLHFKLKQQQK